MRQRRPLLRRAREFAAVMRRLPRRVAQAEQAIAETRAMLRRLSSLEEALHGLDARIAESVALDRQRVEALEEQVGEKGPYLSLGAAIHELGRRTDDSLGHALGRLEALEAEAAEVRRHLQVREVMDWIERASLRSSPLISVIVPTRDRSTLLRRALDSVIGQSYPNWEAVVTDDGSLDDTPAVLKGVADPRVRPLRGEGRGTCAARNLALARASGELIAYLDDDNLMHPQWLKAVAWAFEQRPEADVLYGAFVVDDIERIGGERRGAMPRLFFHPYDHKRVAEQNIADMGCIAHRARLPEACFDEDLREMGDWDLFLRLTREKPPLALPAIACFYTTDAPNRTTNGPTHLQDMATVKRKNRR